MATTPKPKAGRGSGGSFWITRQAIDVLLNHKATATQICAYLILARFTDETGQFSTAGMQAIYKGIGIGQDGAKLAVAELCKMQRPRKAGKAKTLDALVYPAEGWRDSTGHDLPHGPSEMSKVRWVLNGFDAGSDSRVWMSNELVDGIGSFTQPMKRLKRSGDVAARILLLAYREQDLERFGGINPTTMFYDQYNMERVFEVHGGYDLWHGEHENPTVYKICSSPSLGITDWPKDEKQKSELVSKWFRGMSALDSAGFIYQVVSVLDREHTHAEAQVVFELHAKTRHGYKPKGEGGLSGPTAKLSGLLDKPVTDSMGRFYDKYAAVVPAGMETHIIGIWRLRFRVSNPKNHGVRGAWARIHRGQEEALGWIKDVAEQYDLTEKIGFEKPPAEQDEPIEQDFP